MRIPVLTAVAVLLLAGAPARAVTRRVPGTFSTLQSAVSASSTGDTILVAAGTYTGPNNRDVNFGGLNLVLRSESGAAATVIDCQGVGHGLLFTHGESRSARVEGFTVTGSVDGAVGGGILVLGSGPTIQDCVLTGNHALSGGGIACTQNAYPLLTGCAITGNAASTTGGGLLAGQGSNPVLEDCVVAGNTASAGGGIAVLDQSGPAISGCVVTGNSAGQGGGVYALQNGSFSLSSCTVAGNVASTSGGGLHLESPGLSIQGSILWDNCAPSGAAFQLAQGSAGASVTCTLYPASAVDGPGLLTSGGFNLSEDPQFCAATDCADAPTTAGNWGIAPSSPAVSPPGCSRLGALGVACQTPVVHLTWSRLKLQRR